MIPERPLHEYLILQMSEQEWNLWRHSPITSAYLAYLGEQAQAFREAAADLLEAGQLAQQSDMIRGRILTLRELQNLSLDTLQNFYREEATNDTGRP